MTAAAVLAGGALVTAPMAVAAPVASSVSLAADKTVLVAGESATLTATADVPSTLRIVNLATGRNVKSCSAATTCTVSVTLSRGEPVSYQASVGTVTSGVVMVSRAPWSVELQVDRTEIAAGEVAELRATPNQDITKSGYRLSIVDVTDGKMLRQCMTSSTASWVDGSCVVTTSFTRGDPHTYRAYVSSGTSPTTLTDIQATSSDVTVSRVPWTLSLSIDRPEFATGDEVTLVATPGQDITKSGYRLLIIDVTTSTVLRSCSPSATTGWDGDSCSVTTSFTTGPPHTYQAHVAIGSTPTTLTEIQASSGQVSAARAVWTVDLAADRAQFAAGEKVTLTATPNQDVTVGGYRLYIADVTLDKTLAVCTVRTVAAWDGESCSVETSFDTGPEHTYRAYISRGATTIGGGVVVGQPVGQLTDVQAQSGDVTVGRTPWEVELEIDRTEFAAGEKVTLTATPNQDVTVGGYRLYIADVTLDKTLAVCTVRTVAAWDGESCSVETSFDTGPEHTYRAYISRGATTIGGGVVVGQPVGQLTDVQAVSEDVVAGRQAWSTGLAFTRSPDGREVTLTAVTNQDVKKAMPYRLIIQDVTANKSLEVCHGWGGLDKWTSCETTFSLPKEPHVYRSYVTDGPRSTTNQPVGGAFDRLRDIQAVSRDVMVSPDGPTISGETAGGSNPSQACSQRCHGDPVNSVTGEFWETTTDLVVPGVGPTLGLTRSYAATRAAVAGPFGYGWTFDYGMSLVPRGGTDLATSGWVDVVQENGSRAVFTRDEAGVFAAPERTFASLERTEDGGYLFTRRGTQVFEFDASGRLASIADRNGNSVRVVRGDDGLVHSLEDGRGGSITFTWSGDRIASALDHAGRQVDYGYSSAGDLVTVTSPDGAVRSYEYDTRHRVTALTNALGGRTTNTYDSSGRVTAQVDPLGAELRFEYGDGMTTVTNPDGSVTVERHVNGQVVEETVAVGTDVEATTTFTYTATNQVATTTDPLGRVSEFTYDALGNRTRVQDPLGRISTSTFDTFGNPLVVTDPAGAASTSTYDERGNLLSVTDPTGAVTTRSVNPDGTVASTTDALGRTTTFVYDDRAVLTSVTAPDGSVTAFVTDALGRTTSTTDALGAVTSLAYDAAGRVTSTSDALGGVATAEYDAAGNRVATTAADGAVVRSTYDRANRLRTTTDAAGATTTIDYDEAGRVVSVTDAAGATSTTTYDAAGRVVEETDALGRDVGLGYDKAGQLTTSTLPSGAATTYEYDLAGQQVSVTDARGATSTTAYDDAGRPVTVTDADGRSVTSTYDSAGRVTAVTRGDGSVLRWTYDPVGQQTSYTDADGAVTAYSYDVMGRVDARTDQVGRVTRYGYDAVGNLILSTAPDGTVTHQTFDALARVTGRDYAEDTPDVTYAYDSVGRRTAMTDGTGTTEYSYDDAGRLAVVSGASGTVGYTWDEVGRLTALRYPDGGTVARAYDDAGQLTSITDTAAANYSLTWSQDGQPESLTYPNGVTTRYDYDGAGNIAQIASAAPAGEALLALAYSYSDAGLQTGTTVQRDGEESSASGFTWDGQARLASVTGSNAGDLGFTIGDQVALLPDGTALEYDPAGQLTSSTRDGVATSFVYDARGNRASASTVDQSRELVYDSADRLTGVSDIGPATGSWAYSYDGDGLRATTTTRGSDGVEETEQFTWDRSGTVPLLLADGDHTYLYGIGTAPIAQLGDEGTVYLHSDVIGSVRAVTDEDGAVVAESDYAPYGAVLVDAEVRAVAGVTRFGFAGEYTDVTGLVYLRARYFDPRTGQFTSVDALRDLTMSLYGYTGGNPSQFADPLGLDWLQTLADGAAGFGDTVTFGGTKAIRDLYNAAAGWDDAVNYDSGAYVVGALTGTATQIVLPTGGLTTAYGAAATVGGLNSAYASYREGNGGAAFLSAVGVVPVLGSTVSLVGRSAAFSAAAGGTVVRSGTWWSTLGRWSGSAGRFTEFGLLGAWAAEYTTVCR